MCTRSLLVLIVVIGSETLLLAQDTSSTRSSGAEAIIGVGQFEVFSNHRAEPSPIQQVSAVTPVNQELVTSNFPTVAVPPGSVVVPVVTEFGTSTSNLESCIGAGCVGENCLPSPSSQSVECDWRWSVAGFDAWASETHAMMDGLHGCSFGLLFPNGEPWIFAARGDGPLACAWQERFVNWRRSSAYLQGCMPDGYALTCFIETVQPSDAHSGPLTANGLIDRGGSKSEADRLEGSETKSIQQISLDIRPPAGEQVPDSAQKKFDTLTEVQQWPWTQRDWSSHSVYWNASLLNHQPLYFDDVNLERHGFSYGCWQPVVSGVKFFSRIPALPYLIGAEPPHETQFTLGESRPGSHACYVCEQPPLSLKGGALQAAVSTGLVFLIP